MTIAITAKQVKDLEPRLDTTYFVHFKENLGVLKDCEIVRVDAELHHVLIPMERVNEIFFDLFFGKHPNLQYYEAELFKRVLIKILRNYVK